MEFIDSFVNLYNTNYKVRGAIQANCIYLYSRVDWKS